MCADFGSYREWQDWECAFRDLISQYFKWNILNKVEVLRAVDMDTDNSD